MNTRRLASVAVIGVLAVSLTACGNKGGSSSGDKTAGLTAANFSRTVSGAVREQRSVHIAGSVTAAGAHFSLRGDSVLAGRNSKMRMRLDAGQLGNVQVVLANRVIYLKAPQLSRVTGNAGKPWVKINTADPRSTFGSSFSRLLDQADPSKLTNTFKSIKGLRDLGADRVSGVDATHYRVKIGIAAAAKAGGASATELRRAGLPKVANVDVWIDAKQRPVRIAMTVGALVKVNLTFTRWGAPVSVSAPPASQVGVLQHN
jgi:hypothetical protein